MLCDGIGDGVFPVVPQGDELFHMRHVILAHIPRKVVPHVFKGGHGTPVVKSAVLIRQDQKQKTARLEDAFPIVQRFDGIGDVLQIMWRQNKVVCGIRDAIKRWTFSNEVITRSFTLIELERRSWSTSAFPMRYFGENTIVERSNMAIDGKISFKNIAGAADFQTTFTAQMLPY